VLKVLFVAAFSTDAERLAFLSKKIWIVDYVLDNRDISLCLMQKTYDFLLFDFETKGIYPPDALRNIYTNYPTLPIFLLSRQHCLFIEKKISATTKIAGCFAVPYDFNVLNNAIMHLLQEHAVQFGLSGISRTEISPLYTKLQGQSIEIQTVRNFILEAAKRSAHVLLYGESGSGKEVVASLIHHYSHNHNETYLPINTTCIADELAESLLFGSCKGAYTGAPDREGFFSQAHHGTLFLDEIENLSLNLQAKLLRVIETHEYYKLGDNKKHYSDFRLICATNRDLQEMVREGRFRLDLYYRLDVFHLVVPPLRKHKDDIELLARNYLKERKKCLSKDALLLLHECNWPGNVRELFNCLERAIFSAKDSPIIYPQHLDI